MFAEDCATMNTETSVKYHSEEEPGGGGQDPTTVRTIFNHGELSSLV